MNHLLHEPATARPLSLLGLALAALLLLGFHTVVSGALHHAELQRQQGQRFEDATAGCRALADAAQRQLCVLRVEVRAQADDSATLH